MYVPLPQYEDVPLVYQALGDLSALVTRTKPHAERYGQALQVEYISVWVFKKKQVSV